MEQMGRSPTFRGGGSPETLTDALLEHCAELAQTSPSSGCLGYSTAGNVVNGFTEPRELCQLS